MEKFFVQAQWIDLILVAVAIEFVGLAFFAVRTRGIALVPLLFLYLGSGASLLFALRASLAGSPPQWIAAALAFSLVSHIACLQQIFKGMPERDHREADGSRPIRSMPNCPPARID